MLCSQLNSSSKLSWGPELLHRKIHVRNAGGAESHLALHMRLSTELILQAQ